MLSGLRTRWRWHLIKSVDTRVRLCDDRNDSMISGRFDTCLRLATGCALLPGGKKCKLDSVWTSPYLVVALLGWMVGIQKHPDVPVILIHCQDVKKVPQPSGVQSWIAAPQPVGAPAVPMLGASTVAHTSRGSHSITDLP